MPGTHAELPLQGLRRAIRATVDRQTDEVVERLTCLLSVTPDTSKMRSAAWSVSASRDATLVMVESRELLLELW